jgi:hypothetical protein
MSMNGTDILLLVNTGTPESPVYEAAASQRNYTQTENTAARDSSSKDAREAANEPGRYSATLSLEALYIPTDDAFLALQTAMRDGEKILIVRQEDGVEIEGALCVITSLVRNAPDQETATYSAELTLDGAFSAVGS